MEIGFIIVSLVLITAIVFSKIFYRLGTPSVIIFLGSGLLIGSDGLGWVNFNNYHMAQNISTIALIFIMFYGGFGVNLKQAKPILKSAILLSSIGTIFTALLVAAFSTLVLKFSFPQGLLVGSVVASTDAASVFSIFNAHKLSLKNNAGPLLEVESGSNDPFAYMMTILAIELIKYDQNTSIFLFMTQQIIVGVGVSLIISLILSKLFERINLEYDGLYSIFIMAVILLVFGVSSHFGGNGYLTIYLTGIIFNNSRKIPSRRSLVHFFDGISWLMQLVLFLTLGLLVNPSEFKGVILIAIAIGLFLTIIARPLVVFSLLIKSKFTTNDKWLISFAGIRGAASIVFATYALGLDDLFVNDLFNIVFFIALMSVLIQGSLLPYVADKLKVISADKQEVKNLSYYEDEVGAYLVEIIIKENHKWINRNLQAITIPEETWIMMIKRSGIIVVPNGGTKLKLNDIVVVASNNEKIVQELC